MRRILVFLLLAGPALAQFPNFWKRNGDGTMSPKNGESITGTFVGPTSLLTPTVDCICAHGGDSSAFYSGAIQTAYVPVGATGGTGYATTDTWTATGGSCTTTPAGTLTASGGVLATLTVTTKGAGCTTQPTLVPATSGSGAVVLFSSCNSTADAIGSPVAFASAYTVPAGTFAAGVRYRVTADTAITSTASNPGSFSISLRYGTTVLWRTVTVTMVSSLAGNSYTQVFHATGFGTNLIWGSASAVNPQSLSAASTALVQPISVSTAGAATLNVGIQFSSVGVASGTCNDAGNKCGIATVTGSAGQTCLLTSFNGTGGSGATATVYLTGTNTIANGTPIYVTNTGSAYTGTSTTATAGNGTATCTGTAALTTTLGGAQGNAVQLGVLSVQREN